MIGQDYIGTDAGQPAHNIATAIGQLTGSSQPYSIESVVASQATDIVSSADKGPDAAAREPHKKIRERRVKEDAWTMAFNIVEEAGASANEIKTEVEAKAQELGGFIKAEDVNTITGAIGNTGNQAAVKTAITDVTGTESGTPQQPHIEAKQIVKNILARIIRDKASPIAQQSGVAQIANQIDGQAQTIATAINGAKDKLSKLVTGTITGGDINNITGGNGIGKDNGTAVKDAIDNVMATAGQPAPTKQAKIQEKAADIVDRIWTGVSGLAAQVKADKIPEDIFKRALAEVFKDSAKAGTIATNLGTAGDANTIATAITTNLDTKYNLYIKGDIANGIREQP